MEPLTGKVDKIGNQISTRGKNSSMERASTISNPFVFPNFIAEITPISEIMEQMNPFNNNHSIGLDKVVATMFEMMESLSLVAEKQVNVQILQLNSDSSIDSENGAGDVKGYQNKEDNGGYKTHQRSDTFQASTYISQILEMIPYSSFKDMWDARKWKGTHSGSVACVSCFIDLLSSLGILLQTNLS